MNRHFEDTLYYLKRAGETAKRGLTEEVEPVETKVRELTGRETESEPEPGRVEAARRWAVSEAKRAVRGIRETARKYRGRRA